MVETARLELADMDSDRIPARLRKVAGRSDRELPAPFARSILEELETNDEFRAAVADRFVADGEPDELLAEYLTDPASALGGLDERAAGRSRRSADARLAHTEKRAETLSEQLAEAKRRITEMRRTHSKELRRARAADETGRAGTQRRNRDLTRQVAQQDLRIEVLEDEVRELRDRLAERDTRLERSVGPSQRQPGAQTSDAEKAARGNPTPGDPLAYAAWLDSIERTARPFRPRSAVPGDEGTPDPLEIPPGIAPDSGAAVVSLITQVPRRFIIDGYNVAGAIRESDFSTRQARDDVIHRAGRLARNTPADVIVVFDSANEDGRRSFSSVHGVSVRFSGGQSADDAMVELVLAEPSRTVVVSNDREVRARCSVDGCIPIWSTAFIEWGVNDA